MTDASDWMTVVLGPLGALAISVTLLLLERQSHTATRRECAQERAAHTTALADVSTALTSLTELVRHMEGRR